MQVFVDENVKNVFVQEYTEARDELVDIAKHFFEQFAEAVESTQNEVLKNYASLYLVGAVEELFQYAFERGFKRNEDEGDFSFSKCDKLFSVNGVVLVTGEAAVYLENAKHDIYTMALYKNYLFECEPRVSGTTRRLTETDEEELIKLIKDFVGELCDSLNNRVQSAEQLAVDNDNEIYRILKSLFTNTEITIKSGKFSDEAIQRLRKRCEDIRGR